MKIQFGLAKKFSEHNVAFLRRYWKDKSLLDESSQQNPNQFLKKAFEIKKIELQNELKM